MLSFDFFRDLWFDAIPAICVVLCSGVLGFFKPSSLKNGS